MITKTQGDAFAAEWIAAWNAHDLPRVLNHYADDFELSSPFIIAIAGNASGTLRGKAAVRTYWTKALARIPELHFDLIATLRGVRSLVLHYRLHDARLAAEWFEFGADGKVVRSVAHYAN